jgi:hypothetical protein
VYLTSVGLHHLSMPLGHRVFSFRDSATWSKLSCGMWQAIHFNMQFTFDCICFQLQEKVQERQTRCCVNLEGSTMGWCSPNPCTIVYNVEPTWKTNCREHGTARVNIKHTNPATEIQLNSNPQCPFGVLWQICKLESGNSAALCTTIH